MRKHYIDNLRSLAILLLFPVHTFMIWSDFGSRFYIWEGESRLLSTLIVLVNPWFMPLLFVLAGISARHALEKRTKKEFILERLRKLLLPFGKQFLNKQSGFTDSMRRTSYSVYILQQTILIVLAYYVVQHCESMPVQVLTICIGSFLLTYASSAVICTYHSRLKSSSKSM